VERKRAKRSRMEMRMREGGKDYFKGKTGRKLPFCILVRMKMQSGHLRDFKYEI
jgi:hypothetical protein